VTLILQPECALRQYIASSYLFFSWHLNLWRIMSRDCVSVTGV